MARKFLTQQQIVNRLREAEVALSQGSTVAQASRKIGVTEQTYYRWQVRIGRNEPILAAHARTGGRDTARIPSVLEKWHLTRARMHHTYLTGRYLLAAFNYTLSEGS